MARTAVMTGATGRIGTEAVKALAAMGINVVMVTHNPQAAEALSAACAGLPGEVVGMSNEAGDDAVFDDVYERFGSVDILIPNHSAPDSTDPPEEVKAEDIEKKFRHQVVNTFKMIKRASPTSVRRTKTPVMNGQMNACLITAGGSIPHYTSSDAQMRTDKSHNMCRR